MIAVFLCPLVLLCAGCASSDRRADTDPEQIILDLKDYTMQEELPSPEPTDERVQIPDFDITFLNGDSASFSDYYGKKIILNFWATWCGPCVGEMPAFQRLAEEYPDDLVILAVNCSEDQSTVDKFIRENNYTFPIVMDEEGYIQSMFGGITSIPLTAIIDEEGYIVTNHLGASDADTMYEVYKEDLGL